VIGIALFGSTLSYGEFARTLLTAGSDNTLPPDLWHDDERHDAGAVCAGNFDDSVSLSWLVFAP
jgi:ABC-type spermidine/putrescine transport system permease subunit II